MFGEDHSSEIKMGTVGWESDDSHFDLGDQKTNDGYTLVKVQLIEGRDTTQPLSPTVGQGHRIVCQLSSSINRIPTPGTRVYVAIPKGMESAIGAGVIFACVERDRRYNLTDGSLELSTRDGAAKVVIRNDGTIALFTTDDNTDDGKSVYFRVAKDGFRFVAPWGKLTFDETGFHVLHSSGASFDLGGIYGLPSPMDQLSTYATIKAAIIDGRCSAASFGSGALPVADAAQVMLALAELQTQITVFNGALTTFLSTTPGPVVGSALGAALAAVDTAMSAAKAAVAAATTLGTSTIPKTLSAA